MKRRSFLKVIGIGAASLAALPLMKYEDPPNESTSLKVESASVFVPDTIWRNSRTGEVLRVHKVGDNVIEFTRA